LKTSPTVVNEAGDDDAGAFLVIKVQRQVLEMIKKLLP
jgi:hypothetical protein